MLLILAKSANLTHCASRPNMVELKAMNSQFRYFPVDSSLLDWGLRVTCGGRASYSPGAEFPLHAHPDEYFFSWDVGRRLGEWQLVHVTSGGGVVEFEDGQYPVKADSLMVITPGHWHRYRPNARTGWSTQWFGFVGEIGDRLMGPKFFKTCGEVRPIGERRRFVKAFSTTVDMLLGTGLDVPATIAALLEEERSARASSVRADMVLRAQAHIAEHATEIVDFEQLSNMLGVPYRTLRHAFSKEARVSPLQYQLSIRLARAMNMLRSSDMPISEMSHKLGFNSVWHFSHFFRDRVGQSPAAYRNSANNCALPRKVEKLKG